MESAQNNLNIKRKIIIGLAIVAVMIILVIAGTFVLDRMYNYKQQHQQQNIPTIQPTDYNRLNDITGSTYQTPTSIPTTPIQQQMTLTSSFGKTIVIKNIKSGRDSVTDSGTPFNFNMKIRFGSDYITREIMSVGSQSSQEIFEQAKIAEERNATSLIVRATDFKEALKQQNYPYWQIWRFEDDGKVIMNDYDGDSIIGDWSID